ncbi:Transglycosylase SLT domain-containing protein [Enhydrobacter aerosaccus]|uniref:Transglycosylase SLT domain-containing protein n=2 Tax=Hyphomicrobiales TaxID=356 RepID=A0A1T4SIR6_9HYPH|nr:Transglycosylase SLT domain-containing protein [Enhydrobacter aerosaccus]
MPSPPSRSDIPLFHSLPNLSFVPAGFLAAAARGGSPGRLVGRCASVSPWVDARTMAHLRIVGMAARIVVFVVTLVAMTNVAAMAQTAPSVAPLQHQAINDPIAASIAEASRRFGMPATWIHAVMQAESAGDARAVSSKGAMGLMQIMPDTWAELRTRYAFGADPFDIRDNIHAGAAYLRELHDRYGAPGFLAAYHAGPGRYDDYLVNSRPLPVETNAYLAAVIRAIDGMSRDDRLVATDPLAWTQAPLFVPRGQVVSAGTSAAGQRPIDRAPSQHPIASRSALVAQSDGLFVPAGGRNRKP